MMTDFFVIFYWWLLIGVLGLLFFPLILPIFKNFWDKGWVFSKIAAIIVISYFVFVLGRLHILPFCKETLFLGVLLILAADVFILKEKKNWENLREIFSQNWKKFLWGEVIFFIGLAGYAFIRGFQPDIEGLEKFMDFGFVNSILRSSWFPPADMWFAGESINYYYFGHLQAAVLTKLSGLASATTYNLMIGTICGFALAETFSLTSNFIYLYQKDKSKIKNLIIGGLISALLLSLGGNLHTIVYVLKNGAGKYWYPDATRFIGYNPDNPNDKTIHEFPSYSFAVADLHGHLNNVPTVLLFLAVLLVFGAINQNDKSRLKVLGISGFLLGAMFMTNSWDFPIYGGLFAIFIFLTAIKQFSNLTFKTFRTLRTFFAAIKQTFVYGIFTVLVSILTALPFALTFDPMADGIAPVRAWSLWWQLLVLWGFFWFIALGFWFLVIKKAFAKKLADLTAADYLVLALTIWATVLIIIPELIYVKDIYIPEHHRANTMFKLVYQSFMMYSVCAGYVLFRIRETLRKKIILNTLYLILFLIGFSCHMIYPYFAIKGYYGTLKDYRGIGDGLGFLKTNYPDDYEALLWAQENISGQPVILEAVGDSYTMYNHFSALAGLPTIEGWLVHEWLWRGGFDQPGARGEEVDAVYQGDDEVKAQSVLKKYNVQYVFVGALEKEKYPNLKEDRFEILGKKVFEQGETRIYQLRET